MERGISDFVVDGSFGEFLASVEMVTENDVAARKLLDDTNTKNGDWDWIVWGSGCVQEILDVGSNGRKVGVG